MAAARPFLSSEDRGKRGGEWKDPRTSSSKNSEHWRYEGRAGRAEGQKPYPAKKMSRERVIRTISDTKGETKGKTLDHRWSTTLAPRPEKKRDSNHRGPSTKREKSKKKKKIRPSAP